MNLKKTFTLGVLLLQVMGSSCAKIDKFSTAHMLEGFTGVVKVTPGIEGITANTYSPGLVFFNGNKDGTEVILYGPNTANISLYSLLPDEGDYETEEGMTFRQYMNKFKGIPTLDKLDFSGFRATVDPTNGKKIKFVGFGDQSAGMKKFNWKVSGEGIIDGPDSHVRFTISTTVGVLQDMLPGDILEQLQAPNSDVSIREFEDREAVVHLAQIEILGQSLTFGY